MDKSKSLHTLPLFRGFVPPGTIIMQHKYFWMNKSIESQVNVALENLGLAEVTECVKLDGDLWMATFEHGTRVYSDDLHARVITKLEWDKLELNLHNMTDLGVFSQIDFISDIVETENSISTGFTPGEEVYWVERNNGDGQIPKRCIDKIMYVYPSSDGYIKIISRESGESFILHREKNKIIRASNYKKKDFNLDEYLF